MGGMMMASSPVSVTSASSPKELSSIPESSHSTSTGVGKKGSVSTPTSATSPPSNAPTPTSLSSFSSATTARAPAAAKKSANAPPRIEIRPAATRSSSVSSSQPPTPGAVVPVNKMAMASVISPMPSPAPAGKPISMTSKEWVIPPRPKPGRKPATDTPPTKRKAQNRAAQRAFRERRAARVGELEEQLESEKEVRDRTENDLRERVHHLEIEAESLRTRCQMLESALSHERAERGRVTAEFESARRKWHEDSAIPSRRGSVAPNPPSFNAGSSYGQQPSSNQHRTSLPQQQPSRGSTSSVSSLPGSRARGQNGSFSISQIISPPDEVAESTSLTCGSCGPAGPCACAEEVLSQAPVGCGKCSLGTRCECLEAIAASGNGLASGNQTSDLKRRPSSPASLAPDEKRRRSSTAIETDFTALFSQKKRNSSASHAGALPSMLEAIKEDSSVSTNLLPSIEEPRQSEDGCGFCKEGTYCVCADAMATSAPPPLTLPLPTTVPMSQQIQTPPPDAEPIPDPALLAMEIMADGAVKLPKMRSLQSRRNVKPAAIEPSGCGPNGPGTCAQCLADPKSGLFCRSLAANFKRQNGVPSGCCGGNGAAGGCCKAKPQNNQLNPVQTPTRSGLGLSLSCADTYKTLSSHRHFDEAADDIAAWLPKLKVAPKDAGPRGGEKITPIEVEAASIMSVLKGFDVRFGP